MANLTLLDWAKRLDPKGSVAVVANLLSQTNEILTDMVMMKGNLPTGHRCTIQTGLPTIYYRSLNDGVLPSKGTTVQVDENCAIAEARSEMDIDLAMLNGNTRAFRLSESDSFIESLNQTIATGLFYGNPAVNPDQFLGATQRYSSMSAGNAQNILNASTGFSPTANQQTSVWLFCWGQNGVFTIFPDGSKAGLLHEDLGRQTAYEAGGAGKRMEVYADRYQWKIGLVVKDWRSVVRICNVDTPSFENLTDALTPTKNPASPVYRDLLHQMLRAIGRVPVGIRKMCRPVFYMNASVFTVLMRTALEKSHQALSLERAMDQFGRPTQMMSFMGIPIRQVDAIVNTEPVV